MAVPRISRAVQVSTTLHRSRLSLTATARASRHCPETLSLLWKTPSLPLILTRIPTYEVFDPHHLTLDTYDLVRLDATLPLQVERSLGPVAGSNSLDQSKSRLRINAHSIGAVDEQGPVDDQALEGRRQLERIDALQAKVQYMAHEMALLAGKVVAESETGSSDQRMAEKDEKIALLVAEGQILSQAELNHLSIIKKLRTKLATEEKRLLSARSEANEAQKTTQALRDRVSQVELGLSESRLSAVENERRQKAVENATAESEAKTILITQLQRQLEERAMDSKSDAADKLREQLDAERNRNESQAKSLLAAETSKGLTANAQKEKLREAQNAADREKERARLTELDLRRELKVGIHTKKVLHRLLTAFFWPGC